MSARFERRPKTIPPCQAQTLLHRPGSTPPNSHCICWLHHQGPVCTLFHLSKVSITLSHPCAGHQRCSATSCNGAHQEPQSASCKFTALGPLATCHPVKACLHELVTWPCGLHTASGACKHVSACVLLLNQAQQPGSRRVGSTSGAYVRRRTSDILLVAKSTVRAVQSMAALGSTLTEQSKRTDQDMLHRPESGRCPVADPLTWCAVIL
jgi:hypothetical protein